MQLTLTSELVISVVILSRNNVHVVTVAACANQMLSAVVRR